MSTPDPETRALYDARAEDYAALDQPPRIWARLDQFIAALPKGGHALDLGCGPGWAAARMQEAGLRVTALDASPEMARVAKAHYGVEVTTGSFENLSDLGPFDGVWAHFSLLHAPKADFPAHLRRIHAALAPGGSFLIAMKLGKGEARDALGRFYSYYSPADLRHHLTEAGFALATEDQEASMSFDNTPSETMIVTAHA